MLLEGVHEADAVMEGFELGLVKVCIFSPVTRERLCNRDLVQAPKTLAISLS